MTVLQKVESLTTPGRFYEIREGRDGRLYCTCPAWKFGHDCKHLQAYIVTHQPITINSPEARRMLATIGI